MKIDTSEIQSLFEKRISPLVALDGAEIELLSINNEDTMVTVRFGGRYRGSPCRDTILNYVVLPILKQEINASIQVRMAD